MTTITEGLDLKSEAIEKKNQPPILVEYYNGIPGQEILRSEYLKEREKSSVDDYLRSLPEKYYRDLLKVSDTIPAMRQDCQAAIVIAALNEERDIIKTVRVLLENTGLESGGVDLTVVANSSKNIARDGTKKIVEKFAEQQPSSKNRIYCVEVVFNQEEASVGSAKKVAGDLALLRAYAAGREKMADSLPVFISDADVIGVMPGYLKKVQSAIKQGAEISSGSLSWDREFLKTVPNFSNLLSIIKKVSSSLAKYFNISYSIGNARVYTGLAYAKISGMPYGIKTGEDRLSGKKADILKISQADGGFTLETSARRMKDNLYKFAMGTSHTEENFQPTYTTGGSGDINKDIFAGAIKARIDSYTRWILDALEVKGENMDPEEIKRIVQDFFNREIEKVRN